MSVALEQIDLRLADLLRRQALAQAASDQDAELVAMTAALVSSQRAQGHICIRLGDWAGHALAPEGEDNGAPAAVFPPLDVWRARLESSPLVGDGSRPTPLVLSQDGLVYLHRYWQAERRVERHLCELATDEAVLGEGLPAGMFDDEGQAEAARRALGGRLCLISGGPGTGKTTTVARILALLYQAEPGLEVALAAPTGKAAETLGKRVAEEADGLVAAGLIDADLRKRFPDPAAASTLHRLLGFSPRGMLRPKYRDKRSLAFGVVIVDEASMVDLLLMDALLTALPPQGRLILLGDKDQLTSVEAGSVFGDLCGWSQEEGSPLGGSMCILTRNYRFDEASALGQLATAIRDRKAGDALAILDNDEQGEVTRHGRPDDESDIVELLHGEIDSYLEAGSAEDALQRFGRFRILCDMRSGPYGVYRMNRLVEQRLADKGMDTSRSWYKGRPLLVTVNDYNVRLFNGDIGVCWPDPADGRLYAWFGQAGGEAGLRRFPRGRLPTNETAWAMTVHKAQGSEFERVVLCLAGDDSRVLCRELIYTGITRARSRVDIVAEAEVVKAGIEKMAERVSGLGGGRGQQL